ncbi:two-component sensor histidine kinase, partial [Clavibacter nebraskensis]
AAAAAAWAVLTVLLLGVLAALVWADGTSRSMSPAQGALIGILAVVQCAPLAFRRRHPRSTLLAVSLLQGALVAVIPPHFGFCAAAPVVAAYTVGSRLAPASAVRVVAAAIGIETAAITVSTLSP